MAGLASAAVVFVIVIKFITPVVVFLSIFVGYQFLALVRGQYFKDILLFLQFKTFDTFQCL